MKGESPFSGQGYGLLIWDAYRPVSAQFRLWEICPDSTYVANPNTGYSSHSRGNTVDVSLVTASGGSVEMPSGFDDFTARPTGIIPTSPPLLRRTPACSKRS